MIFVTLGSQDKPFDRLVKKIDELVTNGIIKDKVIVQAGCTKVKTNQIELLDFIPIEEFNNYIEKSKYLIAHAGVGSILDGLNHNKKVIAVARLSKYGEIVNDHQLQLIDEFERKGFIIGCRDVDKLEESIKKIKNFQPKKYISNNENFINLIENFINNN